MARLPRPAGTGQAVARRIRHARVDLYGLVDDIAGSRAGAACPAAIGWRTARPAGAPANTLLIKVALLNERQDVKEEAAITRIGRVAPDVAAVLRITPLWSVARVHAHAGRHLLVNVRGVNRRERNVLQ